MGLTGINFPIKDTEEYCLICLRKVEIVDGKVGGEFTSVLNLLRYLNIKDDDVLTPTEKLLTDGGNECGPQLDGVPTGGAQLCGDCLEICGRVSELVRVIDLAKTEISCYVKSIHNTMRAASESSSRMTRFCERMKENDGGTRRLKAVENLRGKLSHKCSQYANFSQPQVVLERLKLSSPGLRLQCHKVKNFERLEVPSDENFSVKVEIDEEQLSEDNQSDIDGLEGMDANSSMESSSLVLHPLKSEPMEMQKGLPPQLENEMDSTSDIPENLSGEPEPIVITNSSSVRFQCSHCPKIFRNTPSLYRHIRNKHKANSKATTCTKCNKAFTPGSVYFSAHLKTCKGAPKSVSKRKFPCSLCNRQYSGYWELQVHFTAVHENVRKYSCDICGKKFLYKSELKPHKDKIHYGKKYLCDVPGCTKEYSRNDVLQLHRKKAH